MLPIANSTQPPTSTSRQLADVRTALTQAMLAQNPGLKLIDAQVRRDDARLSTYGKLALALGDFRALATNAGCTANVSQFVGALNTLSTTLDGLKTGDPKSDTAALKMKAQLGAVFDNAGAAQLAEIGITRKHGALSLDDDKLQKILADRPERVARLFSGRSGVAERMVTQIDRQLGPGGILAGEVALVQRARDKLVAQKTRVIESVERQASFMAQYQISSPLDFPAQEKTV